MVHAVRVRDCACLIEEQGERVVPLLNVFPPLEPAVDLLRGDYDQGRAAFLEFVVSRLQLSQLAIADRSPGAADENDGERFAGVVR